MTSLKNTIMILLHGLFSQYTNTNECPRGEGDGMGKAKRKAKTRRIGEKSTEKETRRNTYFFSHLFQCETFLYTILIINTPVPSFLSECGEKRLLPYKLDMWGKKSSTDMLLFHSRRMRFRE